MSAREQFILKLLCLLPLLVQGSVQAAAPFDPDLVNATTFATQPAGYVGAPVASGYILNGSQVLYAIDYSSQDWSGDLHSYSLSINGAISTTDNWGNGADVQIDAQDFDTERYIVTMNGASKIAFRWANLSTAQKTALDSATLATASSSPILNYIRGERINEAPSGNQYRVRNSVLGDIIHSTPLHWDDGTNKTVFVGANDGMLHAIDAATGTERFAYIPSVLISKLPALKTAPYAHKYFVDGQLAARKFGSQSILVGGLGGGGKGLFALDVTAIPALTETSAASKVLWEITPSAISGTASTSYANLGHTYGTPVLATLPDGTATLIVGNGYNNTGNGRASLFLINPSTGALIAEIAAGATGSVVAPNGLSSPTVVDVDLDGKVDYAYAGDIDGKLWKFDLTARTATALFTTSPVQAITMAPGIKAHPNGGYMVTFVTGRIFTATDEADNAVHYAYGIWDRPAAYAANSVLLTQTLTERTYTGVTPNIRVRTASNNVPNWEAGAANHMGWKTALSAGERVVGDGAFVTGSVFLFLSSNPTINPTTSPPGENWQMQLNALTGGDNNSAILFDLNASATFTSADQVVGSTPLPLLSPVGRHIGGGVRSQLTSFTTPSFDIYLANYDKNGDPIVVSSTTQRGVAGGHFDEDVYYGTALVADSKGKFGATKHVHEYDDIYDKTGVNMLDASSTIFDLANAIPSTTTQFKVIASNQYLSPAVSIHINGSPSYVFNLDQGYIPIKNFITSATLDVTNNAQVPTYTRATVNSLVINMPTDAFTPKDWWAGALGLPADVRVGLHPTQTGCVNRNAGATDGNMYQPVIPPASVTVDGNGTLGYNSTTTPLTATGVRHNGALTIQVIKSTTPNSAIEQSVPNRPEYGWRVKSADYSTYVLAQYTTFWHDKLGGKCYGQSGWTKTAATDTRACGTNDTTTTRKCETEQSAAAGTDPRVGSFGSGSGATPGTTTTTVTNADGSTTTTVVNVVLNADGSTTTTTTINGVPFNSDSIATGGAVDTTGGIGVGLTRPLIPLGRVNWRELLR